MPQSESAGSRDDWRPVRASAIEVCVVVPTLDEAQTIDAIIARVFEVAAASGLGAEVIVADGGSTDGTQDRARAWGRRAPVRLLEDGPGGDLASAVLAAADWAIADVIVVLDADGSHPVEVMPALARAVLADTCEVAIGSRCVEGATITGWPLLRRIGSFAASAPARILTEVRDPLSGFFAMRRERLLELGAGTRGFKLLLEVLVRAGPGLRTREFPIHFRDRVRGVSKASGRVARSYAAQVARLAGVALRAADAARAAVAAAILAGATVALLGAGWAVAEAHFVASVLAWVAVGFLRFRSAEARVVTDGRSAARLAAVSAVALAFGAAVLASLLDSAVHPWVAVVPAALAEAIVLGLGTRMFVRPSAAATPDARLRVVACLTVATSVLLRVALARPVQVLPEEAYYWQYSQHPALGYYDHPPMIGWLLAGATAVLGRSEAAVRLTALACWSIALLFTVTLTRRVAGSAAACVAAMLLSVLPFFVGAGFIAMPDSPLIACWAAALWYLHGALVEGRSRAWWGAGICMGLGMLSKYPMALLGLAALVFIVIDPASRRWLRRPQPYAAAVLAFALFAPVVLWNARNGWASFSFQTSGRFARHEFDLHGFAGALLLTLTPLGALALLHGLRSGETDARVRRFATTLTMVPLGVFAAASLQGQVRANWPGPCILGAVPLLSWAVVSALRARDGALAAAVAACVRPTAALGLVLLALAGHVLTLGVPWLGYPWTYGVGWRDLARAVDRMEARAVASADGPVVIAGLDRYWLASELAFYDDRDGDEEDDVFASANLLGSKGLMYEYWAPPEQLVGRSVLLVTDARAKVADARLLPWFERLEPVEALRIERRGVRVGTWFARVGHGYRLSETRGSVESAR